MNDTEAISEIVDMFKANPRLGLQSVKVSLWPRSLSTSPGISSNYFRGRRLSFVCQPVSNVRTVYVPRPDHLDKSR